MLILSRYDLTKDETKSKVNIYHDGQLIGSVAVKVASHGMCRLAFDMPPDYKILREECECNMGGDGKERAA